MINSRTSYTETRFSSHPVAPCYSRHVYFFFSPPVSKQSLPTQSRLVYLRCLLFKISGPNYLPCRHFSLQKSGLDLQMAWTTKRCFDNRKICTRLSPSITFLFIYSFSFTQKVGITEVHPVYGYDIAQSGNQKQVLDKLITFHSVPCLDQF